MPGQWVRVKVGVRVGAGEHIYGVAIPRGYPVDGSAYYGVQVTDVLLCCSVSSWVTTK